MVVLEAGGFKIKSKSKSNDYHHELARADCLKSELPVWELRKCAVAQNLIKI